MSTLHSNLPLHQSVMLVAVTWAESRSKDPSSKVGACVYDEHSGGLYLGYNGFPAGIDDESEIWENNKEGPDINKYDLVVHAEVNAVRKALMAGVDLEGAILFCTHHPCATCMRDVIGPSGIRQIYFVTDEYRSFTPRVRKVCGYIAGSLGITITKLDMK